MALLTERPKGTKDILPKDSAKWQYLEKTLLSTAELFGFREIRVPTFEHTELFQRSVGDTTDVVNKEMYTFIDRGDRSITLRPEGTAGVARACIENGLLAEALPLKVSYAQSFFRYEQPQSGRFREFHQFGAEMFGATHPVSDAEVISMITEIYEVLGIKGVMIELNSIGCPTCRANYHKALIAYFEGHKETLCDTCHTRLEKNPMRILDCKSKVCGKVADGAPLMLDFLCEDCDSHFAQVKEKLDLCDVQYTVNPTIVRGLDYYTRTVFECVYTEPDGTRIICGGGGRYASLLSKLGGPDQEGIGFAMGLERLLMVMEKTGCDFPPENTCDVFVVSMGDAAVEKAFVMATELRREGFYAQCDLMGRSLRAQMKYANKIGAKYTIVVGDSELETGKATLKSMFGDNHAEIPLGDGFTDAVYDQILKTAYLNMESAAEEI